MTFELKEVSFQLKRYVISTKNICDFNQNTYIFQLKRGVFSNRKIIYFHNGNLCAFNQIFFQLK